MDDGRGRAAQPPNRLRASWVETLGGVRSFVASRIGDADAANDIVQDVLVRSIASGALDQVDDPSRWLYRSARNAVIDHYRTRRRHEHLDGRETLWPDPGALDDRPNRATRDLARCLQPLIHELSPIYRDALTRVDLDGQTHQQAADQLGISVSGMKSRVQRARHQLRDLLTGCCTVELDPGGAVAEYRQNSAGCDCSAES